MNMILYGDKAHEESVRILEQLNAGEPQVPPGWQWIQCDTAVAIEEAACEEGRDSGLHYKIALVDESGEPLPLPADRTAQHQPKAYLSLIAMVAT